MEELKLHDAVVYLAAAGLLIPLARRFRISPVLGFLLIGLAVGPYGLARFSEDAPWLSYLLITDVDGVRALAELGVVFLLFMIGLELSFERLWSMRRLVFGLGSAQIILTGLAIGAVAWAFGNSIQASVLLGSCLALSSTAIVIQLLIEEGRFGEIVGRGSFAILLAQDIAVVPILFLVATLGAQPGGALPLELGLAFAEALFAILVIVGIGRLLVRPFFRFVSSADNPEAFVAATLLIIIATAAITHAAGLSAALGAFLAGLVLAESEYRHEIEISIEPFKGLLLGLFFMSVAMSIDLAVILTEPVWIVAAIVGLFTLKSAITTGLARLFGFGWGHAAEMGLLLGQGGEFAFLVVAMAVGFELLPESTAQFMLIVVGATMLLTPLVARLARSIGMALGGQQQLPLDGKLDISPDLSGHVVIVGYGRTGQLLAKLLDVQQLPHVALDLDADRVARLQARGAPICLGDASRAAMLRKARLDQAAALAVCTDDPGATERVLVSALQVAPEVPVIARARDSDHALQLLKMGAMRVVPEMQESGLHLGQVLLEQVGLPAAAIRELIDMQRLKLQQALQPAAEPPGE